VRVFDLRKRSRGEGVLVDRLPGHIAVRLSCELGKADSPLFAEPKGVPADQPICVLDGDRDPLNADLSLSNLLVERYGEAGIVDMSYLA